MRPCPICRAGTKPMPDNPYAPFCSERCKLIDLGNWLDQSYRIPSSDESSPSGIDDDEALH